MKSRRVFSIFMVAAVAAFSLNSCITSKKMSYLLNMSYDSVYKSMPAPELKMQPEDKLGIHVKSEIPALAAPFNGVMGSEEGASSGGKMAEYTIERDGSINFPVLGQLNVEGMTAKQIEDLIAKKISQRGDIKNPEVSVSLKNFKITVIGSVGNSVLSVEEPSINLLQVIARSGGIRENSKLTDVMVVRTENGQRIAHQVNLQDEKSVFESPVFFLQQNDVVYVKHRGTYLNQTGQTAMTFFGALLTVASIVTNFILWHNK